MPYILTLIFFIVFYIAAIRCFDFMKKTKLWNFAFTVTIVTLYLALVLTVFFDVGLYDWNFTNTLPIANVSPFMFSAISLFYLCPKKKRSHLYLLVSLLSVGMFLSTAFGCIYNASINYKFHLHFLYDYVAHILLSLWGVYIIKTKQVRTTKKDCIISASIIIGAAFFMLVLNLIFDTSFFGLSLRGKHNIYNNVLTQSSYLSAILYFAGLIFVLLMGLALVRTVEGCERKKLNKSNSEN